MTLESTKKVVRGSWDAIPIPDTVIARVNALGQGQPNDLDFLDRKKIPIGELDITGLNAMETQAPHIDLIEPETDLDHISDGTEKLLELVERQDIPTIDIEKGMDIAKEDGTLEAAEQIIDSTVPSLVEVEILVTIYMDKIDTPEETPGLHR